MSGAIKLIAEAVPDDYVPALPETPQDGTCCLTGRDEPTIRRKHVLGDSFTQWDLLARPDSQRIGVSVWRAWMFGWREDGKNRDYRPERMSSWIVTPKGFRRLSRQDVRGAVLSPQHPEPWAGYATTSYKKHGSLLAPVNSAGTNRWLWETQVVDCSDVAQVGKLWENLRCWQDAGIPRPVLETADPEPHLIRKIGVRKALDFQEWAWPLRQSRLYQFLVYLLPSAEELKELRKDGSEQAGQDAGVGPLFADAPAS